MNNTDIATRLFMEGYNCAQATAAAFDKDFGIGRLDLLKMTAGFGGGMGGLKEQCGAVSAMVLVAGLYLGEYSPKKVIPKKKLFKLVRKMMAEFTKKYGTVNCRELLDKLPGLPPSDLSGITGEQYKNRPCVRFVIEASEILRKNIIC